MKAVIALAVLATSAVSYGASRDIYDIMYLPNAGTTYGFTALENENRSAEADFDTELKGNRVRQTIGHSLSDRLTLAASMDYASIETEPEVGDTSEQTGISDPTISARYRLLDEKSMFDIVGGALISLGNNEVEADGDEDNKQGGHSIFVGGQYGMKTENMQWAVLGQFTKHLERTEKSDEATVKDDAHDTILVRADLLNKLAEKSFIRSFLSADFVDEFEDNKGRTTVPETIYTVGVEYQHLLSKDLLLRGGIDYAMRNYDSNRVDSDNTTTLRLAANYQF